MKWLNQLRRGSNLLLILVILYGLICGRLGKSGSFYWVVFGAVLAVSTALDYIAAKRGGESGRFPLLALLTSAALFVWFVFECFT